MSKNANFVLSYDREFAWISVDTCPDGSNYTFYKVNGSSKILSVIIKGCMVSLIVGGKIFLQYRCVFSP